jgi:serine/threonine protein kinase/nitrous oxidase accessory protein NosD
MPITTVIDLVKEVVQLQVLTSAQRTELESSLAPNIPEPRPLAGELIKRGWLTPFQVNLLFTNRAQELRLGPYTLLERIGEGGMGQVYKALHTVLRRIDAVKTIRLGPQLPRSGDSLPRFLQEAMATGKVDHKHLVAVRTAEAKGDTFYLAMELIDGMDLGRLLQREPDGLPVGLACDYIRQAALGLQHAHEKGLVHRDVKPSNLMATRDGLVKVLDLGLACIRSAEQSETRLTRPGAMMGTPDYMPPEQFNNAQAVDERSDVYSLGCTLYHLLAGKPPFPEGTIMEKMRHHCDHEPVPLHEKRPEVPPELSAVVHRMMAKDPAARVQTAQDVARALAPFCQSTDAIPVAVVAPAAMPVRVPEPPQAEVPTERGQEDDSLPAAPPPRPSSGPTVIEPPARPRRRALLYAGGGVLAAGMLVLLFVTLGGKKTEDPPREDKKDDKTATRDKDREKDKETNKDKNKDKDKAEEEEKKPTLVVDPNGTGPKTIRDALSKAAAGTRIRIKPGTYREALVLHTSVELVGDGPVEQVILESERADPLVVTADKVVVRGLTIRCKTGENKNHHAVDCPQGYILLRDCVIESDSLACVCVRGEAGLRATLRHCTIVSQNTGGVLIIEKAEGLLEDCDIQGKTKSGLEAQHSARVTARRCKIHDSEAHGALLGDESQATLEDCHFFKNGNSNLVIVAQCKAKVVGCHVYQGKPYGVRIDGNGGSVLENCDIRENVLVDLRLSRGSNPTLRQCRIHDGKTGVFCSHTATGLLEDCHIFGHQIAEVETQSGANPRLVRCHLYNGKGAGVQAVDKGEGLLEECELYGHKSSCAKTAADGKLTLTRCKLHDGQECGAKVLSKSELTLDRCEVYGNVKAGLAVLEGKAAVRGGKLVRNGEFGVVVADGAEAEVEGCDLRGNALGPWLLEKMAKVKRTNNQE